MRRHVALPAEIRVPVAGTEVACLAWGDGPLCVMVHGFPDTAKSWDLVGPRVAATGYRVVAPYTRGIAPTPVPADGRYDDEARGRDILDLIDALGGAPAVVVGHDFGAPAAYAAAAIGGLEKVRKLVTLAIPHPATLRFTPANLWGARHFVAHRLPGAARRFAADDFAQIRVLYERWSPGFAWPDSEFDAAKNSYSEPGSLEAALAYYKAISPVLSPAMKRKIAVPTLIVGGKTDGVLREEAYQASRRMFTGPVDIRMVPGGHFLHREHPEAFLEVLLPFLAA